MSTHSDSGTSIEAVHVRAPHSKPLNKVFILFGEHSRELISPESGLRLLQGLCGEADLPGYSKDRVRSLLHDSEFFMILNGNPSSREMVEGGQFCLRTNPNGVDLNRNWDEMWQEQAAVYGDTNPGPSPFSEPETRIFKKLVEKYQPTTFLTVHSGTRGLYMPWAYDTEHLAHFNGHNMLNVLEELDKQHCQCPYGAAGKEVGYPCPGTCLDWVYSKLKTPYVFAFEIYTSPDRDADLSQRWNDSMEKGGASLLQRGNSLGHSHFEDIFTQFSSDFVQTSQSKDHHSLNLNMKDEECFDTFNPGTEASYKETVDNWASAYLDMTQKVAAKLKHSKN